MSAVEIGKALKKDCGDNAEIDQYEKKLVQVSMKQLCKHVLLQGLLIP